MKINSTAPASTFPLFHFSTFPSLSPFMAREAAQIGSLKKKEKKKKKLNSSIKKPGKPETYRPTYLPTYLNEARYLSRLNE